MPSPGPEQRGRQRANPVSAACGSPSRPAPLLQPVERNSALPITPPGIKGETADNGERQPIRGPYEGRIAAHREKGADIGHFGSPQRIAGCADAAGSRAEWGAAAGTALRRSAMALRSFNTVRIRSISSATNNSEKPAAITSNGTSIEMSIRGPPIRMTLAGWCRVFHQSTENLMIGRLTTPTSASTEPALPPREGSSNAFTNAIYPR